MRHLAIDHVYPNINEMVLNLWLSYHSYLKYKVWSM